MLQLTDKEYDTLKFQLGTSKIRGRRRYNSYVFTEQGVAMLSSVLHTEIAIKNYLVPTLIEQQSVYLSRKQGYNLMIINGIVINLCIYW